jgi:hypothetical protein
VADDDSEKFHRGDTAVAAAEGNVVQLGLQNIRLEVVEELSEAEEELFASDPQGERESEWESEGSGGRGRECVRETVGMRGGKGEVAAWPALDVGSEGRSFV